MIRLEMLHIYDKSTRGIGVAMDNAQPVLKEKSDFVTLSNDQDGVAEAVKHFWKELA